MSRTHRREKSGRDHRGRRRDQAAPGIKRLGERDLGDKRSRVIAWMREQDTDIVTIGSVTGFRFAFRFKEVWTHMFPNIPCPSRK